MPSQYSWFLSNLNVSKLFKKNLKNISYQKLKFCGKVKLCYVESNRIHFYKSTFKEIEIYRIINAIFMMFIVN